MDDPIARLCEESQVDCSCGLPDDVLYRFYQATLTYSSRMIVRLTRDCPLADPQLIDRLIEFYEQNKFDYVSNALEPLEVKQGPYLGPGEKEQF